MALFCFHCQLVGQDQVSSLDRTIRICVRRRASDWGYKEGQDNTENRVGDSDLETVNFNADFLKALQEARTGCCGSTEVRPTKLSFLSLGVWGRLQPGPWTQNRKIASSDYLRVKNSKAFGSLGPPQDYRLARLAP